MKDKFWVESPTWREWIKANLHLILFKKINIYFYLFIWLRQVLAAASQACFLKTIFFFLMKYSLIWQHWVLVVAYELFLVPWSRTRPGPPAQGAQSLNHWPTRHTIRSSVSQSCPTLQNWLWANVSHACCWNLPAAFPRVYSCGLYYPHCVAPNVFQCFLSHGPENIVVFTEICRMQFGKCWPGVSGSHCCFCKQMAAFTY